MIDLNIRASSLGRLFDCPARWAAQNITGRRWWTGGPAHLGTSVHYATGRFDQARIEGTPIDVGDAVQFCIDKIDQPDGDVLWDRDLSRSEAKNIGAIITMKYCERIAPLFTFEAVELTCNPMHIDMHNGVTINLTGTLDRMRVETIDEVTKRGIGDVKTGRGAARDGVPVVDKHVAQLGTYELLGIMAKETTGKDMVLPAQVFALPTNGDDIAVGEVETPSRVLLGEGDHGGLLQAAATLAKSGNFYGNPHSTLCSKRYCPNYEFCWWRGKS